MNSKRRKFKKEKLAEAFAAMRKMGLVARLNVGNVSKMETELQARWRQFPAKRRQVEVGYVLARASNRYIDQGRNFWLDYDHFHNGQNNPLRTQQVGRMVCAALEAAGIPYEWDGDDSIAIEVIVN